MSTKGGSRRDLYHTIHTLQAEIAKLRESAIPSTELLAAVECEREALKPKATQDGVWVEGYEACLRWVTTWAVNRKAANAALTGAPRVPSNGVVGAQP
jgi:hypothetical protein